LTIEQIDALMEQLAQIIEDNINYHINLIQKICCLALCHPLSFKSSASTQNFPPYALVPGQRPDHVATVQYERSTGINQGLTCRALEIFVA